MDWTMALIGVAVFLALVICGVRIAFAALMAALTTFLVVYHSLGTAGSTIASSFINESSEYTLTVIPLFVFMGYLAFHYGIGEDIFKAARYWLGRLPGGLAIATTVGCAFFGAICGVSAAAAAVFGKAAVPEMEKANYHWSLSVGSVAASGTLASLIPPSTMMVIYGMLAEQSIGKILIAGFIPGIVSAAIYSFMMLGRSIRDPKLGPPAPPTSLREKFASLKGMITVFIVMVIIIGGLYSGVFTPTEAGACGAFVILLACFIRQRGLGWPLLKAALLDTARVSCMIFTLLIAIKVMTAALVSTDAIGAMVSFFQTAVVPPYVLLLFAMIIYIILGAFVGVMGMLVMTVPFFVPILMGVGFDPIWLGIIVIKFCEIGLITPPIGGNVFVTAQVTGREVSDCFKAILWFLAMDLLTVGVLVAFPQIVLFLPSQMG